MSCLSVVAGFCSPPRTHPPLAARSGTPRSWCTGYTIYYAILYYSSLDYTILYYTILYYTIVYQARVGGAVAQREPGGAESTN